MGLQELVSPDLAPYVIGVNNRNQILGFYYIPPDTNIFAYVWEDGVLETSYMGGLGSSVFANDINDAGIVVGGWHDPARGGHENAAVWDQDGVTFLPHERPNATNLWDSANAINNSGDIIGRYILWGEKDVIFDMADVVQPGVDTFLLYLNDINDRGEIVSVAVVDKAVKLLTPVYIGNQPPDAQGQVLQVPQGNGVVVTLTADNVDADPLSFEIVHQPLHGTVVGTLPSATYIPDAGYAGVDSFSFRVHDGYEYGKVASIAIRVTGNETPLVIAGQDLADVYYSLPVNLSFSGSAGDDGLPFGTLSTTWSLQSGPASVSISDASSLQTDVSFPVDGTYVLELQADDGELVGSDTLVVDIFTNGPPSADAGADQSVFFGDLAFLDANATDDGQPFYYAQYGIYFTWSKLSGPGTVTFSNVHGTNITAAFSEPGLYEIQLAAFDWHLYGYDTVQVMVSAPNLAPTADAGADQTITLPASASLNGSIADDGLPSNSVLATWSKISGPGTVAFGNANAEDTTASFSTDGTYVLQLLADDGELTASDTVTITVNPIPNQAPSVDAGGDFSQKWKKRKWYPLDGTVTDDGLPNPPGATSTIWSKVSGPGSVTFSNANAVNTTAKFSKRGTYVLKLHADDGDLVSDDTITITLTRR